MVLDVYKRQHMDGAVAASNGITNYFRHNDFLTGAVSVPLLAESNGAASAEQLVY